MYINPNIAAMPGSYLFQEIDNRVDSFLKRYSGRPVLRLGIGDVTLPLPKYIAEEFAKAALNMSTRKVSGLPPYRVTLLIDKILKNDYLTAV